MKSAGTAYASATPSDKDCVRIPHCLRRICFEISEAQPLAAASPPDTVLQYDHSSAAPSPHTTPAFPAGCGNNGADCNSAFYHGAIRPD